MQQLLREKKNFLYLPKCGSNKRLAKIIRVDGMILTQIEQESLLPLAIECFPKVDKDNSRVKSEAEIFAEDPAVFLAYLEKTLDHFDGQFNQDSATTTFLYFKRTALAITAKTIVELNYNDLPGYIWRSQIIDHNLDLQSIQSAKESKFFDFIQGLCYFSVEATEEDRICHLSSIMGAMLNTSSHCKNRLFILADTTYGCYLNDGDSHTRLIVKAIAKFRKTKVLDATYLDDPMDALTMVSEDMQFLIFKNVTTCDKEKISLILENRLGMKICLLAKLPFEDQGDYQFSAFPATREAGWIRLLLDLNMDMEKLELDKFFSLMAYIAQFYLDRGLVDSPDINCTGMIQLINETCREFVLFMKKFTKVREDNSWVQKLEHYNSPGFSSESIDMRTFKYWVAKYAKVANFDMIETATIAEEIFRFEFAERN